MRQLLFFLLLYGHISVSTAVDLPDIGSSADTLITRAQQRQYGDMLYKSLHKYNLITEDIAADTYIQSLGNRLASFAKAADQPFHFFLINDKSINAFATFGGYIGVHIGLVLSSRSEGELAAVLAHEISHITQQHLSRSLEKRKRNTIPLMIASAVALAAGAASGDGDVIEAAAAVASYGSYMLELKFTRDHEKEADRLGMQVLSDAGFNPYDMPAFFDVLYKKSRYYTKYPEFLSSHPISLNRLSEATNLANKLPKFNSLKEGTPLYHLIRARLLVASTDKLSPLIQQLDTMLIDKRYRSEKAVHYALALAQLKLHRPEQAKPHIDWLDKYDEKRVLYHDLHAQYQIEKGNDQQAATLYKTALSLYPKDNFLGLQYAKHLISLQQGQAAFQLLSSLNNTYYPIYYLYLSQAYQLLGKKIQAHINLAEYHALRGELKAAIAQLTLIRRQKNVDYYLLTKVNARLKELNKAYNEIKALDNS